MSIPKKDLVALANCNFDFLSLLSQIGVNNPRIGQVIFCPFHEDRDTNKKSAKIFSNAIHCFSEQRQYRSYDILKQLGYSDLTIERSLIANNCTKKYEYVYVNLLTDEILSLKDKYMKNKINSLEYIDQVVIKFVEQLK
jgi:hypothetical protein